MVLISAMPWVRCTMIDCVFFVVCEGVDGAEPQERVLKDSEQMIPRTKAALQAGVLALDDLVVRHFALSRFWDLPQSALLWCRVGEQALRCSPRFGTMRM